MPDDYAGMGRLNAKIQSTRMATGEHESSRFGFELLADYEAADIWQPDMHWCGGLTEMRWIDALARSKNTPVIPHAGWRGVAQGIARRTVEARRDHRSPLAQRS